MILKDDRTKEQESTHYVLIGGEDTFLSGWGEAKGGVSYAFWACEDEYADQVEEWVKDRGDMKRVKRVTSLKNILANQGNGHCHIYVARPGIHYQVSE